MRESILVLFFVGSLCGILTIGLLSMKGDIPIEQEVLTTREQTSLEEESLTTEEHPSVDGKTRYMFTEASWAVWFPDL